MFWCILGGACTLNGAGNIFSLHFQYNLAKEASPSQAPAAVLYARDASIRPATVVEPFTPGDEGPEKGGGSMC